jgi:hypothetical protein
MGADIRGVGVGSSEPDVVASVRKSMTALVRKIGDGSGGSFSLDGEHGAGLSLASGRQLSASQPISGGGGGGERKESGAAEARELARVNSKT